MNEQQKTLVIPLGVGVLIGSALGLWVLTSGIFRSPQKQPDIAVAARQAPAVMAEKPTPLPVSTESRLPTGPLLTKSSQPNSQQQELLQQKLRTIAFAFHNYHSSHNEFPPKITRKPPSQLSWRVELLPYLEQQPLYEKFHRNEPWDSPHNLQLLAFMPDVYRALENEKSSTHFHVFTGDETLFNLKTRATFRRCSDGASNTFLLVYADKAEPWTKPIDLIFDANRPKTGLGVSDGKILGVLLDATSIALPETISEDTIAALVTPSGREVVDGHGLSRRYRDATPTPKTHQLVQRATMQRLKDLVLAMHFYHDTRGSYPPAWQEVLETPERPGRPAVSWRVLILPYLEQQNLYKKYDRNKEWDHPDNLALLPSMPSVYRHESDLTGSQTRLHVFSGPDAMFEVPTATTRKARRSRGLSYRDAKDGTDRTLLLIEAGPETATPWTKPSSLEMNPENPLDSLGTLDPKGFPAAMVDGSVKWVTSDIAPDTFQAMVLRSDGQ